MNSDNSKLHDFLYISFYFYFSGLVFVHIYNLIYKEKELFETEAVRFFYQTDSIIVFMSFFLIAYIYLTLRRPNVPVVNFELDEDSLDNPFESKDFDLDK